MLIPKISAPYLPAKRQPQTLYPASKRQRAGGGQGIAHALGEAGAAVAVVDVVRASAGGTLRPALKRRRACRRRAGHRGARSRMRWARRARRWRWWDVVCATAEDPMPCTEEAGGACRRRAGHRARVRACAGRGGRGGGGGGRRVRDRGGHRGGARPAGASAAWRSWRTSRAPRTASGCASMDAGWNRKSPIEKKKKW